MNYKVTLRSASKIIETLPPQHATETVDVEVVDRGNPVQNNMAAISAAQDKMGDGWTVLRVERA